MFYTSSPLCFLQAQHAVVICSTVVVPTKKHRDRYSKEHIQTIRNMCSCSTHKLSWVHFNSWNERLTYFSSQNDNGASVKVQISASSPIPLATKTKLPPMKVEFCFHCQTPGIFLSLFFAKFNVLSRHMPCISGHQNCRDIQAFGLFSAWMI